MRQQETERSAKDLKRSASELGRRERLLAFNTAAVLSLLVHAGILVAVLDLIAHTGHGAIVEQSDAVSIELVATDTLEALMPAGTSDPAPSPEATAPAAGSPTPSEPSDTAERREKHEPVETTPDAAPDADHAQSRAAHKGELPDVPTRPTVAAVPAPDSPADIMRPKAMVEDEDAQPKPREARQIERKTAQPKGGITLKAKAGKGTAAARVSAGTGSILTYAALVRARVAGNRPSGGTAGGTAVVAFGLTSAGALAYARIARSSGDAANDRTALAAVRGAAPFPPPPAGATPSQLQFTIPYYFQ